MFLACVLGIQTLLSGMALAGAATPTDKSAFSRLCATATSGQDPLAPGEHGHEHGLCCILHTDLASPSVPFGVGLRRTPPADSRLPASRENQIAARAPPELEPLAPRGPPSLEI
ncbi:hypothetical protein B1812_06375 [Methylocystis bryophila]|uniref:DUF2946 domain-containing protein n=2 Tax=Methylocystis bryophila TaxID=655015 RepID=A0A1W6MT21_9HYPH|nr:hypothetical protein B1812_06375 [Methylocystis bryophila]